MQRLERKQEQARAQDAFAFKEAFAAEPPENNHDLTAYGYYKSRQLAAEGNAALYLAAKTQRDRGFEFVMLHDLSGSDTMFETLPPDPDKTIRIAPSHYERLTRMLDAVPVIQKRVLHHIDGYHHPKDDRLKVLGPHYSETPILTTQFLPRWLDGQLEITEHDRYPGIGFDTERQRPPVSLALVEKKLGASASASGTTQQDPVRELGPEGPSDEYLNAQRNRRETLLSYGFIYKNERFWSQFDGSDIQSIFEGRYYQTQGYLGNAALMYYLSQNNARCGAQIVDPKRFLVEEKTIRTDGQGNQTINTSVVWDLQVPARFIPYLKRNFDNAAQKSTAGQSINDIFGRLRTPFVEQARDLDEMRRLIETVQRDIRRLLDMGDCAAPIKRHLEQMLFHYAAQKDPKLHAALDRKLAESVSDRLYQRGSSEDIKTACLAANDFTNSRRTIEYCACVQQVIGRNAPERVARYSKRYRALRADYRAAKLAVQRGLDHPDMKVFGNLDASCVRAR